MGVNEVNKSASASEYISGTGGQYKDPYKGLPSSDVSGTNTEELAKVMIPEKRQADINITHVAPSIVEKTGYAPDISKLGAFEEIDEATLSARAEMVDTIFGEGMNQITGMETAVIANNDLDFGSITASNFFI